MLIVTGIIPFIVVCAMTITTQTQDLGLREMVDPRTLWEKDVALAAKQVIKRYLAGCHLVLASPSSSRVLLPLIRELFGIGELAVFTEPCKDSKISYESHTENGFRKNDEISLFWHEVWGSTKATCRGLLLDYTTCDISTPARFLSWSGLWLQPTTWVVMFGFRKDVNVLFRHSALRNTLHVLYITYDLFTSYDESGRQALVYHRCLYCTAREARGRLLFRWNLDDGISEDIRMVTDQAQDLLGHKMAIVLMPYFPYINHKVVQHASSTTLHLDDSLNTRMITTLARDLNFTYELLEPADKQWGAEAGSGNWTGIVGTLQHEMADFSMDLTLTPGRAKVVEFSRAYIDESLVILSSKPKPLPEYLSLVRPLEGEVWAAIFVCVMVWGSILWILERMSHWINGRRYLSFSSSIFYGWGLLLEDHPFEPPPTPSSQLHVGWWLLVYLILSTAYKSSLISHLVVQGKSSVINSMEELAERGEQKGWVWGVAGVMTGAYRTYFVSSPSPSILNVYENIKIIEKEEGMKRVLDGGFSLIDNYYSVKTLVSTFYTDTTGYTPVHISTSRYPLFSGNAWAFRQGAPFRSSIDNGIQRLLDAGLITKWMNEVILTQVRKDRQTSKERSVGPQLTPITGSDGQVVLGLSHLQGTFYILLLGLTLASHSFFCEFLWRRRCLSCSIPKTRFVQ